MDVTRVVELLLHQPDRDQQRVIEAIWGSFQPQCRWPVHDYVARAVEAHNIDLDAVLSEAPTWTQPAYGWFVVPTTGGAALPSAQVSLTVAGLTHAPGAESVVDGYLTVLRALAARWQQIPNEPHRPAELTVRYADLIGYLGRGVGGVAKPLVDAVESLLSMEPATWGGNRAGNPGDWTWSVPRTVTRFADVVNVGSYLTTLAATLGAHVHRATPVVVQSTTVDSSPPDATGLHPFLRRSAVPLFDNGHFAAAVFDAFKAVEVRVRELSGIDESGRKLMQRAFGGTAPVIDVSVEAGRAGLDEQEGFTLIFMGVMQGIRNPKAHLLIEQEDQQRAFEYLAMASILLRRLDDAADQKAGTV